MIKEGTESGERLENSNDNQTILAKGGDDTVMNWGSNVSLDADGGNDSIYSDGSFVTITGGTGNDTVNNWGANTSIFGGAGNDTVLNQGESVLVDTGTDDGFVQNTGANATLTATDGKNFFANNADSVMMAGGSDSDTVHNQGAQVSIDSGAGDDSIQNAGSDVTIEMAGGNDVIENFASSVTIGGGDDDDTIGNWTGSDNVSIDGGAGNDSIYNNGGDNVTLGGGAGSDDISNFYASVTIDGGDDNDTIYNEAPDVVITGGSGSDTITNKAVIYSGETGTVSPDNVSINGGEGDDSLINTGGDNVTLGGGKNVSMTGGKGNDTLTGSSQAEVFVYEAGNDVITNYSGEDTVKIAAGSIDSVSVDDTDLIFKIGDGSLTLKNMQDRYITVTDADGNTTTQTYGSTGYSAQEAIINLVHAWNKTFLKDTAKLDEAIKLSTPFNGVQEVIDQMLADCRAAGDADTFLRKYCGIIRDNADTGAITGWDAGGASIRTGDDIVGETLPATQVPDYTNTTFTARNLTINIASSGSSLNATGKKVLDGIYSWWADEAVRLIEESYKLSFSDGDSIRVEMVPSASYAGNTSSTGVVKFNQGNAKFDGDDDYNGNGMDKTVAHEFTHVAQYKLMGGSLPQFLMEGLADLTAGIDDGTDTKNAWLDSLGGSADSLASYLDLDNDGTGSTPYYVAGYMFYRYLARQAALNYDAAQKYAFKDGSAISGTDGDDLLTGSGSNVSISGGKGNDTVTAYGDGMKVQGDAGDDTIYNSGNNVVFGYADGDGNDSIVGFNDTSTLQIAADDFNTSKSGDNVIVTVGDGKITLRGAASLNTVNIVKKEETDLIITGTEGADSLSNTLDGATIQALGGNDSINNFGSSVSIDGGAGDDLISIGGSNNLIRYAAGEGNDTIQNFNDTSTLSIGSAYSSAISGDDIVLTVGDGKITLTGAAGLDTLNIVGGAQGDAELATSLVGAMLYRTEAGYPVIAGLALNPEVYHSDEPDNYAAKETWTIESSDGLELSGVHYTPENSNDKWVVIIHGYGHNHKHMWPFLGFYLENGYNVLMVDQRAAGDSEGDWLTMGAAESADIALWTQEIARRNPNSKITLFGASMGAATAMLAAARSDTANVTSLVEDCGYTNVVEIINRFNDLIINTDQETIDLMPDIAESLTGYNLKDAAPIDSIAAVTVPSLFISGNDDSVVPVSMLSDLYDASGADVKETFIVDGAGHGKAGLEDPVGYSNTVFRFLAEANEEGWETENIVDGISLRGTSYNDTITNSGASVTLNTGAGDDSITNTGDNVLFLYAAGDGNDTIQNFNETATLSIGDGTGSYSKETLDGDVIITVGDGKVILTGAASLDTLNIAGTEANASIINASSGTLVTGTANNDTIVNSGASVTIDALAGDDYIHNDQDGYSASISGGDGNDTIINDGNLSTVNGGKGDDYIDVYSGSIGGGGFIEYAAGDGFDTVVGYMAEDGVMDYRLQITGSTYTSAKSGNDVVLGVGDGSITLKDAAQAAEWNGIDIVGTLAGGGVSVNNSVDNTTIGGTIYDDTISNSAEYVVINALGGTDIITNSAGNVAIFAGDDADVINNGAGNVTIDAGDGNDVIGTTGSNVSIVGGDGDDSVDNEYGHDSTISTGDGSDTVNNYNSNNVSINAGAGNDSIENSGSGASINASAGDDSIINSGSGALINAGTGDDSISNSGTLVTLNTGAGNDSIIDNTGSSVTVDMGAGDDSIQNAGSNVSINGGGDADTFYNGGTKYPGVGSYTLRGGDSVTLAGGDGSDFISNLRGDSVSMDGGAGDDTISNSGDYVTITALEGNNEISNGGGAEAKGGNNSSIITGDGNDSIRVHNADNVTIDAGGGDDYITSARYNNSVEVHAGTGNDTIGGLYSHYSTLDGGDGNDFISDYSDNSSLVGGAGNDTISVSSGGFGNNLTINGGTGDDLITIGGSNNLIQYATGDGNDSISGFNDTSTLSIGGSAYSSVVSGDDLILTVGNDSITLSDAASLTTVNILGTLEGDDAKTVTYDNSSASRVTLASNIEIGDATARTDAIRIVGNALDNSILGGSGKDTLYGQAGDDYLAGGDGADKLYGKDGDDTLWGGEGNDTLTGGKGADLFIHTAGKDVIADFKAEDILQLGDGTSTYSTRISGNNVIVTVGDGRVTLKDAAKLSTLNILGKEQAPTANYDDSSAARVTLGSNIEIGDATARTDAIRIVGNTLDNSIVGGAGKDTLYGQSGDDYLEGGDGADKLYGKDGDDTLWGGEGNDTLSGGNGADLFIHTAGKDVITDFKAEDTLQLGDGTSTYSTRISGNNVIVTVGDGRVTLKDAAKLSTLNILGKEQAPTANYDDSSAARVTLGSNIEIGDATARTNAIRIVGNALDNSILGGSGKDTLYGQSGNDYLAGGDDSDKLYGKDGDDTLWGGMGNDTLTGGKGADTFIYNDGEGRDVVTDFGDDDLLQITDGFTTSYNASAGTITFKFDDGRLTLKNVTASGTFNVNGDSYHISGKQLVKQ